MNVIDPRGLDGILGGIVGAIFGGGIGFIGGGPVGAIIGGIIGGIGGYGPHPPFHGEYCPAPSDGGQGGSTDPGYVVNPQVFTR